MQSFLEFSEEVGLDEAKTPSQKIDFKRVMAGAMSRDDYNKKHGLGNYAEKSGKSKVDPTGVYHNLIKGVKEETDKDLPFTPDKKKTKPSTPGKYGDAYSTVRNLARKALEKQAKMKKEDVSIDEEQIDEKSAQARANKARKNVMDAGRGIAYRQKTGVNLEPKDTGHDSYQAMNKALGRQLRREDLEENAPVAPSLGVHRIGVTVSDPGHTSVSKRNEKVQKFVKVTSNNKESAIERGKKFYAKKGWKVHDAEHAGMVHEEVEMEEGWYQKASPSYARTRHGQDLNKKAEDEHYDKQTPKMQDAINRHLRTGKSYKDAVTAASKHVKEETVDEGYRGGLSSSDYMPGAVRHDLSNIKPKKQEPQRDRPVADIDPDWEKEQAAKRKKQRMAEGYRGNSEADKPFFDARDHKTAAEKARKDKDAFSYHMHMAAHHDSMSKWNSNKGRHHVADQHMNKAEQHEHDAQQARKESK